MSALSYEEEQILRLEEEIEGFEQTALTAFLSGGSLNLILYRINLHRENLRHVHMQFIMPECEDKTPFCENCFAELQADEIGLFTSKICYICHKIGE